MQELKIRNQNPIFKQNLQKSINHRIKEIKKSRQEHNIHKCDDKKCGKHFNNQESIPRLSSVNFRYMFFAFINILINVSNIIFNRVYHIPL